MGKRRPWQAGTQHTQATITEDTMAELYTAGKLAETLGISAGKVKKLLEELKISADSAKGACKYYGDAALKKLKAAVK